MLVLSRGTGEAVKIGSDVYVVVTSIQAGRVKLGIVAPQEVRVERCNYPSRDDGDCEKSGSSR